MNSLWTPVMCSGVLHLSRWSTYSVGLVHPKPVIEVLPKWFQELIRASGRASMQRDDPDTDVGELAADTYLDGKEVGLSGSVSSAGLLHILHGLFVRALECCAGVGRSGRWSQGNCKSCA